MNLKELLEQRKAFLAEISKPETDETKFNELRAKIERLDVAIELAQKQEKEERAAAELDKTISDEEKRAARLPNGVVHDDKKAQENELRKKENEELEKRANDLKSGKAVELKRSAVASSSTALSALASGEINPAFEQVGSLDKLVNVTDLTGSGAESYKKPFAKTYGTGVITAEGNAPSSSAEPTFDYATINKIKIVAYCELNEEVKKLPAANYMAEIEKSAHGAFRKKVIQQIVNGSGSSQLVGIVNTPSTIIESTQRKTIATIDENTLDSVIFEYGGDESVEDDAVLILNKLTLKEFAKVKGSDKKRAYDIVIKGNVGTINGVPFVCTSNLAAFGSVTAGNPYMLYGKLKGYELTYFSKEEVEISKDYKFKDGIIAFKVTGYVGGSCAMWNGFMSVQKAAPTPPESGVQG